MLAVWRVHGFDTIAREAWEEGLVLAGSSGGMHGWFEACVTDSFGPQLQGMRHFDDEESRRPFYHQLVDHEPAGYAADSGRCSLPRNGTGRGRHSSYGRRACIPHRTGPRNAPRYTPSDVARPISHQASRLAPAAFSKVSWRRIRPPGSGSRRARGRAGPSSPSSSPRVTAAPI